MTAGMGDAGQAAFPVATRAAGVIGSPARLGGLHNHNLSLAVQDVLYGGDDMLRLERFAVVLADVAVGRDAGLGPQVARELAALAVLDDDDAPAPAEESSAPP